MYRCTYILTHHYSSIIINSKTKNKYYKVMKKINWKTAIALLIGIVIILTIINKKENNKIKKDIWFNSVETRDFNYKDRF
jgi:uncharacterized membrane protein